MWLSLGVLAYIYAGYPIFLFIAQRFAGEKVQKGSIIPKVTIVIAAYNEEQHIKKTIENKLLLDYPKEKLEMIVVSDGSTDGTDRIAASFQEAGVRFLRQEPRQGKTAALNRAILEADGEIIVFSDANSLYATDALRKLVANFADNTVGYVTGNLRYVNIDGSVIGDGCSRYMRYENALRVAETHIGSVVGVNGGIDAVRKQHYEPMSSDQIPDFVLPLRIVQKGYRVVFEPEAFLYEEALGRTNDEYRMRVRVSLRSMRAIRDMRHMLNPFRYGLFAWQFLSHKVLRYFAFMFMSASFLANAFLLGKGEVYTMLFVLQAAFYLSALAGLVIERNGKSSGFFYVPFYFCLLNFASGRAFVKLVQGERQITWVPRKG